MSLRKRWRSAVTGRFAPKKVALQVPEEYVGESTERTYTLRQVKQICNVAQLEGAPPVEQVIRDLDERMVAVMDVGLILLVVVAGVAAVVALVRDRRADYEEPVTLESPSSSRSPLAWYEEEGR